MRRKTGLSQKDINNLLKHPDIGFISTGAILLLYGLFCLNFDGSLSTSFLAIGGLLIAIGIVILITKHVRHDNKYAREDTPMEVQYNNAKEQPPTYKLLSVAFNPNTRLCKIDISEYKKYRTVERYITRNYEKYPVLSPWKSKSKTITKSIRLTNTELEKLNRHSDFLIRKFSTEIIQNIERIVPLPSWYRKDRITAEYNCLLERNNDKRNRLLQEYRTLKSSSDQRISRLNAIIKQSELTLQKQNDIKAKADKNLAVAKSRKKSTILNIVTLGIYVYLTSPNYISRLSDIAERASEQCELTQRKIVEAKESIKEEQNSVRAKKEEVDRQCMKIDQANSTIEKEMKEKIASIHPLSDLPDASTDFMPLKLFIGVEYRKIVGIYIIKNNENGKCYVGQSKDIMRRIKQHFKGTEPNNIIFAKDYYSSSFGDKSTLFSIKIIECDKSELDETEKHYITEYDSYTNGYNSTQGNNE